MRSFHATGLAALKSLLVLAACGDSATVSAGDGGTSPQDAGLNVPSCDDNGAYVRLTLAGPSGKPLEWGNGKFTECHGGKVQNASLQFNFAKGAPGGSFYVTLTSQGDVAVGKALPAKVNLSVQGIQTNVSVDVSWQTGCVADVTEVTQVGRFDNGQGPAYGIWEAYTGSVRCDTPKRALQGGDYTLPKAEFKGIFYRLVMR